MKAVRLLPLVLMSACATAPGGPGWVKTCADDPARQKLRSDELQKIVKADQDDRSGPFDAIDWSKVTPRDEARRERVGEIFGEGCFKTAADYAAAALVYQHGDLPDHYFQTFLWARKAIQLGDVSEKKLMADGADRYLTDSGYKQLFATQASKPTMNPKDCWCLDEVSDRLPEATRIEYGKRSMKEAFAWIDELNEHAPNCSPAKICAADLKEPPPGEIPGF